MKFKNIRSGVYYANEYAILRWDADEDWQLSHGKWNVYYQGGRIGSEETLRNAKHLAREHAELLAGAST